MILQSLSKAIREQNWFAVALEFVIVVAGVVIGFQLSQLAQTQAEERRAEELLTLVAAEMTTNQTTIARYRERLELDIGQMTELRKGLAGFDDESDTDQLSWLLSQAVRSRGLNVETAVLDQLGDAGIQRFIQGSDVEAAVRAWRGSFGALRRSEEILEEIVGVDWQDRYPAMSFEAITSVFPSFGVAEAVPPRFETDWSALSQDADLAGRLAVKTLNMEAAYLRAEQLQERTAELIEAIETGADL